MSSVFRFFTGKKGSDSPNVRLTAMPSKDSKTKYEDAFRNFEKCYLEQWSVGKRGQNLDGIKGGIEMFSHSADHEAIYAETYKPVIDMVLNYPYLSGIRESLLLMEKSLKNPSNATLKRFDEARDEVKSKIENEEKNGRAVLKFLMSGQIFKQSLDANVKRDAAGLFAYYVLLSIAEKEYFGSLCAAKANIASPVTA